MSGFDLTAGFMTYSP